MQQVNELGTAAGNLLGMFGDLCCSQAYQVRLDCLPRHSCHIVMLSHPRPHDALYLLLPYTVSLQLSHDCHGPFGTRRQLFNFIWFLVVIVQVRSLGGPVAWNPLKVSLMVCKYMSFLISFFF